MSNVKKITSLNNKPRNGFVFYIVCVSIAVIILLGGIFSSFIAEKNSLHLDLTNNKFYNFSPGSRNFLTSVDKPVKIIFFTEYESINHNFVSEFDVSPYQVQIYELLSLCEKTSPQITVDYVKPSDLISLGYSSLNINTNDIVVSSGNKITKISSDDIFIDSQKVPTVGAVSNFEQQLIRAIAYVSTNKQNLISVVGGNLESDVSDFIAFLEENNYRIVHVDLSAQDIDPDTSILLLAAPGQDLSTEELNKVKNFLANRADNNRSLFYIASYDQPERDFFPNLSKFLYDWNIEIGGSVVFEADTSKLISFPSLYESFAEYSNSGFQIENSNEKIKPAVYYCKPITYNTNGTAKVLTFPLWETSLQSGIYPKDFLGTWKASEEYFSGPMGVLLISVDKQNFEKETAYSSVVVLSSYSSLSEKVLKSPAASNSQYLLSLFGKLTGGDRSLNIPGKLPDSSLLSIPDSHQNIIFIVLVLVLPLSIFAAGFVVVLKRKISRQ